MNGSKRLLIDPESNFIHPNLIGKKPQAFSPGKIGIESQDKDSCQYCEGGKKNGSFCQVCRGTGKIIFTAAGGNNGSNGSKTT
jgi:hypothetical protein